MSSKGLDGFQIHTNATLRMLFAGDESPVVSGVRLRLWVVAATGELGPVGLLPQDDKKLAEWGNVSFDQWIAMKARITRSWTEEAGYWVIPWLVEEVERRERRASKRKRVTAGESR